MTQLSTEDWLKFYKKQLEKEFADDPEGLKAAIQNFRNLAKNYSNKPENQAVLNVFPPGEKEVLKFVATDLESDEHSSTVQKLADIYHRTVFGSIPKRDLGDTCSDTNVILGFQGDTPVGAIWYTEISTENLHETCYINRLIVRQEFSHQNLGSLLLNEVLESITRSDSVAVHSWYRAVEFYHQNGFLSPDVLYTIGDEDLGDQVFHEMVLPLSRRAFWAYRNIRGRELFSGLEDYLTPQELMDYIGAISNLKCPTDLVLPFHENPFTYLHYKKLGFQHTLMSTNEKIEN